MEGTLGSCLFLRAAGGCVDRLLPAQKSPDHSVFFIARSLDLFVHFFHHMLQRFPFSLSRSRSAPFHSSLSQGTALWRTSFHCIRNWCLWSYCQECFSTCWLEGIVQVKGCVWLHLATRLWSFGATEPVSCRATTTCVTIYHRFQLVHTGSDVKTCWIGWGHLAYFLTAAANQQGETNYLLAFNKKIPPPKSHLMDAPGLLFFLQFEVLENTCVCDVFVSFKSCRGWNAFCLV